MKKENTIPVTITEKALRNIREIMTRKNVSDEYGLRVGVKGSGCGGTAYLLAFDKPKPTDEIYKTGNLTVLIEKKHFLYVFDTVIDYEETNEGAGFVFKKQE